MRPGMISSTSLTSKYQPIGLKSRQGLGQTGVGGKVLGGRATTLSKSSSLGASGTIASRQQRTAASNPSMRTLTFVKLDEALSSPSVENMQNMNSQRLTSSFGAGNNREPVSKQSSSSQINLAIKAGSFTTRQSMHEFRKLTPSNTYGVMSPKQLAQTMKDSRRSTTSLVSSSSGQIMKLHNQTLSHKKPIAEKTDTNKPLPTILKQTLKRARERLLEKNIISDTPADREKFPTYDISDPLKCTPRELTLKLIKQHEFLMHRVVGMNDSMVKRDTSMRQVGLDNSDILRVDDADATGSYQADVSVRSLMRENSRMRKQLESMRIQIEEKGEDEVDSQANFIDSVKDQIQSASSMRNQNSQLQLKVMEAERQAKDAFTQLADLQDQCAKDRDEADMLRLQLAEVQKRLDEQLAKQVANQSVDNDRAQVQEAQEDDQDQLNVQQEYLLSQPSNMSQFADEVKQQFLQQKVNDQINMLNATSESSPTPVKQEQINGALVEDVQNRCICTCNKEQKMIESHNNSALVSFARDDSRNVGTTDQFSLQALNDSLSNNMHEIKLRAKRQERSGTNTIKRSKRSKSNVSPWRQSTKSQQKAESNSKLTHSFKQATNKAVLASSLNNYEAGMQDLVTVPIEEHAKLTARLGALQEKYAALVGELAGNKEKLADLLEENNQTRVKFTTLLDTFQAYILEQDKNKQRLLAANQKHDDERKNLNSAVREDSNEEEDSEDGDEFDDFEDGDDDIDRADSRQDKMDQHSPSNQGKRHQMSQKSLGTRMAQDEQEEFELEANNNRDKKSLESSSIKKKRPKNAAKPQQRSMTLIDSLEQYNSRRDDAGAIELISITEQKNAAKANEQDKGLFKRSKFDKRVMSQSSSSISFRNDKNQAKVEPPGQLNHIEQACKDVAYATLVTSPRQVTAGVISSKDSLQLEAEASQSSFSFAVTPSQKPLFIQSVYLASLIRKLLNQWEQTVVGATAGSPLSSTKSKKYASQEHYHSRLMTNLTNLDDQQLLTKMLASLQITLSFVQNLQEGIQVEDQSNVCEIKQTWQSILSSIQLNQLTSHEDIAEVTKRLSEPIENLSRMYVNKCLELSMYKQAIVSKGNDAQLMLKASIDDLMLLKSENARLREATENKIFEQRYCSSHQRQQQSQESLQTIGFHAHSFGAKQRLSTEQLAQPDEACYQCKKLQSAFNNCEEQMREGKSKMQESAIIISEVAAELKQKDEQIRQLAAKLVQILLIIDSGKTYETVGEDLEKLSDLVYHKVASLFNKCTKEKRQNKSFQETMLKELDNLNQALIRKRNKKRAGGGDRPQNLPKHGASKRNASTVKAAEEGPEQMKTTELIRICDGGEQQKYLSSYGKQVYGERSGDMPKSIPRSSSVSSTQKENQKFIAVFQDLKQKMFRHQSPRQQQHPQAQNSKVQYPVPSSSHGYQFSPSPTRNEAPLATRVMSCDSMTYRPQIASTDIAVTGKRNQFSDAMTYDTQRYLMMSSQSSSQFSPRGPLSIASTQKLYNNNAMTVSQPVEQYKQGMNAYRSNIEGIVDAQRFQNQCRNEAAYLRFAEASASSPPNQQRLAHHQLTMANRPTSQAIAPYMSSYANQLAKNQTFTHGGGGHSRDN